MISPAHAARVVLGGQRCRLVTSRRSQAVRRGARPLRVAAIFEEDVLDSLSIGVTGLLQRDQKALELQEGAFEEEQAQASTSTSAPQQQEQRPARRRAAAGEGAPQRSRQAIDAGLARFAEGDYQGAIDLWQLALELPGTGFVREAGRPKEVSCASEGEENAALFNMACAYARLGQRQPALTVLEALLENEFSDYTSIRSDADLAALQGPELDALLAKHDNLVNKLFGKKKNSSSSGTKPWVQW